MSGAASHDLYVRQGNNFRQTFRFKNRDGDLFDLSGVSLIFYLSAGGSPITKTMTLNIAEATATIVLSIAETRRLTIGRVDQYEIESRHDGIERTLIKGYAVVSKGINPDG